jgi:hypothetical protein
MFNFIDIYSFIRVSGCVGRGPGCDSIVAGFTTTYAHSWRGVLDTTLCDKVCQLLATSHWFSPGTPGSSANKTDRPQYNWNIVESGVKHHKPKPNQTCSNHH